MVRRTLLVGVIAALAFSSIGAAADEDDALPVTDPAALAEVVPGGECTQESDFDAPDRYFVDDQGQLTTDKLGQPLEGTTVEGSSACERLRIVFGPIVVKPGQNDVLIQPVTFEKPMYDGYMVRFKPNLISVDGTPPVEDLHLHHGTWLDSASPRKYGWGPWLASGEEKTIATWPHRFGLRIEQRDVWLFLHMVHSAVPTPRPVWVTYDIDFIPAEAAEVPQADGEPLITNTKGIWLDVGGGDFHPETEPYPFNPVFNIQRGHGDVVDPARGQHTLDLYGQHYAEKGLTATECYYPAQNCALFNSQNNISAQQGKDVSNDALGDGWNAPRVLGKDWKFPNDAFGESGKGTLILMGGHLHNGGLRDEVELVRDLDGDGKYREDEERLIHISDAYYWDHENPSRAGGPPVSWDFSMSGVSYDLGWAVNVEAGDILRLNGIYDSAIGSWYEQMGIVMAWVVPGKHFGVDMFATDENGEYVVDIDHGISELAVVPDGPDGTALANDCSPSATNLCVRGQITHPHSAASGNHNNRAGDPLPSGLVEGPMLDGEIYIGGFTFGPFDLGLAAGTGIPRLQVGEPVTITNVDTAAYLWHTLTRCAAPCTAPTTASYPYPDGAYQDLIDPAYGSGAEQGKTVQELLAARGADPMDFDSAELGVGLAPSGKISWDFTPERTGTFTFFCRIHPFMRGAFEVVDAAA